MVDGTLDAGNRGADVELRSRADRGSHSVDFDPHVAGHIASLAHPGGRITGMTHIQTDLPAKRVELLKELLPSARRIAVLADSTTTDQLARRRRSLPALGIALRN